MQSTHDRLSYACMGCVATASTCCRAPLSQSRNHVYQLCTYVAPRMKLDITIFSVIEGEPRGQKVVSNLKNQKVAEHIQHKILDEMRLIFGFSNLGHFFDPLVSPWPWYI